MVETRPSHQEAVGRAGHDGNGKKPNDEIWRNRIFIVDNHPAVREWLAGLINRQSDLKVCGHAGGPAEALNLIAHSKPHVAIVSTSMDGRSGIELIVNIKAACPEVVVIALAMHDEMIPEERAVRPGAGGCAMKPEAARKVLQAIRCVLDGKLNLVNGVARMLAGKFVQEEAFAPGFPVDLITNRELEVFKLLGRGYGKREIAQELHLSVNTVRCFCGRIKEKLMLSSAAELLREAVRNHDKLFGGEHALLAGACSDVRERQGTNDGPHGIYANGKTSMPNGAKVMDGDTPSAGVLVRRLSNRELEVFRLLGRACTVRQIAREMHVSSKTVHTFRARIKEKLKLSCADELLREALRWHDVRSLKWFSPDSWIKHIEKAQKRSR
jgi:DNA-binding NarL/FixJ family response regulator